MKRAVFRLGFEKKILLGATIILAIPMAMQGQAHRQTFDVASLKLAADQNIIWAWPQRSPGRFTWTTPLMFLARYAFNMQLDRISGASGNIPGWGNNYELAATLDPKATEDEIRLMLRSLLEDRFKIAWHFETKESDGWALTLAKNGPKILGYKDEDPAPPMPESEKGSNPVTAEGAIWGHLAVPNIVSLTGRRITMTQFCGYLETDLDKPVWDETGLKDKYYIAFRYATENAPIDVDAPPLNNALQQSLGLKLEKRKGPASFVVIDHIESVPSAN